MIQTRSVVERLQQSWPGLAITIEQIHTRGDLNTEAPLTQIGSDGVFVTEIERVLEDGRIDMAVHSLKDLPTAQPHGLAVAVVGPREDVRDAMVSRANGQINALEFQAQLSRIAEPLRIGTCSLRRTAQILRLSPDARMLPLRGNVDTRLRKLDAGDYDAIVLAAAGLRRLDLAAKLAGRISYFPIETIMPAPGQGALAVETRDESEMHELLRPIVNREAQAATSAERNFMRRLGAGCYLPVAAYAEIVGETLTLHGLVISLDGQHHVRVQQRMHWSAYTSLEYAEQLGISLAEEALTQGADEIIRGLDAGGASGNVGTPLVGVRGMGVRGVGRGVGADAGAVLQGKRILVTRASEQASALSDRLKALGATPIELPMIRVAPPENWQPLDDALQLLCAQEHHQEKPYYAWLIFTSANGVNYFFERLRKLGYQTASIHQARIAAIGAATQAALAQQSINADLVPDEFVAEGLIDAMIEDARRQRETLDGQHVLLARAAEARKVLPIALQQAGALVDDVAVYQTLPVVADNGTGQDVLRMLQASQLDMLTFTSSSTVRNFVQWLHERIGNDDRIGNNPGRPQGATLAVALDPLIACIGPVTAQTARELGLHVDIEAKESTIDGLIEAILRNEEQSWRNKR